MTFSFFYFKCFFFFKYYYIDNKNPMALKLRAIYQLLVCSVSYVDLKILYLMSSLRVITIINIVFGTLFLLFNWHSFTYRKRLLIYFKTFTFIPHISSSIPSYVYVQNFKVNVLRLYTCWKFANRRTLFERIMSH